MHSPHFHLENNLHFPKLSSSITSSMAFFWFLKPPPRQTDHLLLPYRFPPCSTAPKQFTLLVLSKAPWGWVLLIVVVLSAFRGLPNHGLLLKGCKWMNDKWRDLHFNLETLDCSKKKFLTVSTAHSSWGCRHSQAEVKDRPTLIWEQGPRPQPIECHPGPLWEACGIGWLRFYYKTTGLVLSKGKHFWKHSAWVRGIPSLEKESCFPGQ